MTAPTSARLRSPEEIALHAGQQVPFLRLPERRTAFAEREMRLRQRAAGHPMGDFLRFVAELSHCQHEVLQRLNDAVLPDRAALDAAAHRGEPPLAATAWPRDPAWRRQFHDIVDTLLPRLAGTAAHASVLPLLEADPAWLEQQADRVLNGVMLGLDLAAAPLVVAALQAHWMHLVTSTQEAHAGAAPFGRIDDATACPCCGSRPTASIVRIGAEDAGYRYLHCWLCSTQWHMVRIKCSCCQKTKGIEYLSLQPNASSEATQAAVEAETCGGCGHYLKIVHMARDVHVDPVADDLATVMLDLLVAEAGFERHGVNPLLLFGDPEPASQDGGSA